MYLTALGNDGYFYRRAIQGNVIKYANQPVGVNKLDKFMKDICSKGNLDGNYTNHSGKRTCATSLYNAGIDEQEIMVRTGHRSTTSDLIQKQVSSALDPKPTDAKISKPNDVTEHVHAKHVQKESKDVTSALPEVPNAGPLSDITAKCGVVNFTGCTFNF